MTTAITKYSKKKLAVIDGIRLRNVVDAQIKDMFTRLEEAGKNLATVTQMHKQYTGDDAREEKILQAAVTSARKESIAAADAINTYLDDQRALFSSKGCNPELAYTHAIVPVEDKDGSEKFRMIKRGIALDACDIADDEDRSVNATIALPSVNFGIEDEHRRGKYNDGGYLIEQAACSLDRSELYS